MKISLKILLPMLSDAIGAKFITREGIVEHTEALGVFYDTREQYWLKLKPSTRPLSKSS